MNETEFVEFLKRDFSFSRGVGIGDDTSIIKTGDTYQLITKDILVENIHFNRDYFSMEDIALKAIEVNISDIAAMGGKPEYFYLGLGFPSESGKIDLKDFFKGIKKGCRKWDVELAGGDYSKASEIFISITMVGTSPSPVRRSGAETGDLVGVSRITGESAIGLELLKAGIKNNYFAKKHIETEPEIVKGLELNGYVSSMIDISDGLIIDLKRLLESSGKGAVIHYEKIPATKKMEDICKKYSFDKKQFVLSGGEDFALLFTIDERSEKLLSKKKISYRIIGKIVKEKGLKIMEGGKILEISHEGYDHLSKG
ncbi:MAG: thiamine-phosphate kinase [Acidobacteriota bacterium]